MTFGVDTPLTMEEKLLAAGATAAAPGEAGQWIVDVIPGKCAVCAEVARALASVGMS